MLTIDGIDFRDLCLEELRDQVALAHGTEMFTGSVLENVAVGRPEVDANAVREALAAVGLLDDVLDLARGLQTQISMSGRPLSPGQTCRLALARVIAGNPRLLILDGAFDTIDDPTLRGEIAERIFDRQNPWTLLCVSARPDLLSRCDRIYRLEHGSLTELGDYATSSRGDA